MNGMRQILEDSVVRLFSQQLDRDVLTRIEETGWPLWYEMAVVVMILVGVMAGVEIGRRLYLNSHPDFFSS